MGSGARVATGSAVAVGATMTPGTAVSVGTAAVVGSTNTVGAAGTVVGVASPPQAARIRMTAAEVNMVPFIPSIFTLISPLRFHVRG